MELLLAQDKAYRQSLLGDAKSVVVVEAGIEMAGPSQGLISALSE